MDFTKIFLIKNSIKHISENERCQLEHEIYQREKSNVSRLKFRQRKNENSKIS